MESVASDRPVLLVPLGIRAEVVELAGRRDQSPSPGSHDALIVAIGSTPEGDWPTLADR